jgi:hypothetical protein
MVIKGEKFEGIFAQNTIFGCKQARLPD